MELLKTMQHYFEVNQCYPGNDYWSKLFEKAVEKDKLSLPVEASPMPKIAEIEEMQKQLGILKTENEKLKFMIDKGLGWDDMINDISYPPRD